MTNNEMQLLQQGMIPPRPILEIVEQWVGEHSEVVGERNGNCLLLLAEKTRMPFNTLDTLVRMPERAGPLPFEVADEILSACGMVHAWWSTLSDYYDAVNLNVRTCAHPSCDEMFQVMPECVFEGCDRISSSRSLCHKHEEFARFRARKVSAVTGESLTSLMDANFPKVGHRGKGHMKVYCSQKCAQSHWQARKHDVKNPKRLKKYIPGQTCHNGHERNEENTITLASGKKRCRQCNREAAKRAYKAKLSRDRRRAA